MFASLRSLIKDSRGTAALVFGIALVPLMLGVAMAVDYGRATLLKTNLQQSLDAAVLAGVQSDPADRVSAANAYLEAALGPQATALNASFTSNPDGSLSGRATAQSSVVFGRLLGTNFVTVSASSEAVPTTIASSTPGPVTCMVALDPVAQSAFNDVGITNVNANCRVVVNSSNADAVALTGQAALHSQQNCIVGGYSLAGQSSITPTPVSCKAMADPFASVATPTVGDCTASNFQKSSFTGSVSPGVYCGGMTFTSSTVTFSPGIYIIKNGGLSLNSGTFSGKGVVFYFTGSNTTLQVGGNSTVSFTAPTSGTLASFVYFFDPSSSSAGTSTATGTTQTYYEGVLYMPTQNVTLVGTSSTSASSPFTAMIADTFHFTGNATVTINADASETDVPIPDALQTQTSITTYRLM
jgi:Flp pilus assembly protein TadG